MLKGKPSEEVKMKYLCFCPSREEWEAVCVVCEVGVYILVANKHTFDLKIVHFKPRRTMGA